MKSIGTQIAIDMYNCSDILLDDVIGIEHMLSSAAARFGMEPSGVYVNDEDGIDEYSVFAHCKQGHITMHVYPDMGFATIDIFTCFKEADPDGLARFMRKYFNPDKSKITSGTRRFWQRKRYEAAPQITYKNHTQSQNPWQKII